MMPLDEKALKTGLNVRYNGFAASVVELVDAIDSKSIDSDIMSVRVRPEAPIKNPMQTSGFLMGLINESQAIGQRLFASIFDCAIG